MWVLGTDRVPLGKQYMLLPAEPFLFSFFLGVFETLVLLGHCEMAEAKTLGVNTVVSLQ